MVAPRNIALALINQKTSYPHLPLGQILVNMGVLNVNQLAQALRRQNGLQYDAGSQMIKIEAAKVDSLLHTLEELIQLQSGMTEYSIKHINSILEKQSDLVKSAWDTTTDIGKISIGPTFRKMTGIIKDAATRQGKRIRPEAAGQDIKVERHMADNSYEPLLHIMRNSLAHGLATPKERRRGIAEKPSYPPLASDSTSEEMLARFFHPDFSTAGVITENKNAGLDIVENVPKQLSGAISTSSRPGQGSRYVTTFHNHKI